jgi:CheY-like chemotaxis protein
MSGHDVARRIRATQGAAPILLAVTGYGQLEDQRQSSEAGFDGHLTKPVFADHLSTVLATLARTRGHRAAGPVAS